MEILMKIIAKVLASTFLISSVYALTPAYADTTASPNVSSAEEVKSDAKHEMKVEKHIKELHAKLKITLAEESQWDAVAKVMHDNATQLDQVIDKREANIKTATAVDDLNAYAEIAQAHADGVKKLSEAFSPLYASMSDDQKKVADEVFLHRTHHGKNKHKGMK
jgi:periplasmic protein CpxP/Spy